MSHILPITQVDSTGIDATDTTNHAVRVNVVAGGGGGGGGYPTPSSVVHTFPNAIDEVVISCASMSVLEGVNTAQTGGFGDNLFLFGSGDNVTWAQGIPIAFDNSGTPWFQNSGTITASVVNFRANIAGFNYVRIRRGTAGGGTSTWTFTVTPAVWPVHSFNSIVGEPGGIRADVDNAGNLKVFVNNNSIPVSPAQHTGTAVTSVNDDITAQTLLAQNNSRIGATIFNDSTATLYVKLSTANDASTTSFTIKLGAGGYWEVPFNYSGLISGIWDANTAGAARITEIT